jgi:uncharacterized membrane protein
MVVSVAFIIMGIGVGIIVRGAYCSVLRLIALESAAPRGREPQADLAFVRLLFALYLLPGLDFLVAGGVIKALVVLDWRQAAVLGGVVLTRILLGAAVKWETGSASGVASGALPDSSEPVRNGALVGRLPLAPPSPPCPTRSTEEESSLEAGAVR